MHRITGLALKQRSVVLLATILIGLMGIFAIVRLQMELLPDIDIPVVSVITTYPGVEPSSVDSQLSSPIAASLRGISDLKNVQSISSEGFSVVVAEFDYGTDMGAATDQIRNAVSALALPDGVQPSIERINIDTFPIIQLSLVASGDEDLTALHAVAESTIAPALAAADGVSRAEVTGGSDDQVLIALDPEAMAETGVTVTTISDVLQANNLSMPAGVVLSGDASLPVRVSHQVGSLEDIEALVVGANPETEEPVTIGDVATVEVAPAAAPGVSRTNGEPSIAIDVYMVQGANTVDTAAAVREALDETIDDLAASGVEIEPVLLLDQSEFIEESIDALIKEAGFGALFAVIVIFLFLLSLRSTVVAAVSIPASILVAFLLLWWQDITLNIMTLGGLAVAVGRVVDDSIVVLESIYRHIQRGKKPMRAALDGTREVALAITASTVTTIAVFLPLGLVGGIIGEIFLPFALTVTFALLASLLVALTIVPVLASFLISKDKIRPAATRPNLLQRIYLPALRFSLRRPVVVIAVAGAMLVASFGLLPFIGTSFLPSSADKVVSIEVEMPAGTSQEATVERTAEIEEAINSIVEVETLQTQIGGEGLFAALLGSGNSRASIVATLDSSTNLDDALSDLRTGLEPVAGDAQVTIEEFGMGFGGSNSIEVIVTGADYDRVSEVATALTEQIAGVENLANVENDVVSAKPEFIIDVDPVAAAQIGSSPAQIATQVREALAGGSGGMVVVDGAPFPTTILVSGAGSSTDALGTLPVGSPPATPLSDVATLTESEGPVQVLRIDGERAATVSGTITVNETGGVTQDVQSIIDDFEEPEGVDIMLGGVSQEQSEAFASMGIALFLAVALVYLVMVVSFGSLSTPFVILFSLPLAIIGVLGALAITGKTLGLPALIGVLMLVGIVVTNAIVLLEYVIDLQKNKGMSVSEALYEGGKVRLRPILMTALATILALTPLALSGEGGSIIASDLAVVVIGGLLTSTLLTLLVVPAMYKLIGGWQERRRLAKGEADSDPFSDAAPEASEPAGATG